MVDKYAHLRPRRDRQCYRADGMPKFRHPNKVLADEVAERYEDYHSYQCTRCGFWHVGSWVTGPVTQDEKDEYGETAVHEADGEQPGDEAAG